MSDDARARAVEALEQMEKEKRQGFWGLLVIGLLLFTGSWTAGPGTLVHDYRLDGAALLGGIGLVIYSARRLWDLRA